jgi:hypothetical protein
MHIAARMFFDAIHGGVGPCCQFVAAEAVVGGDSCADGRLNYKLTILQLSLYLELPQTMLPF